MNNEAAFVMMKRMNGTHLVIPTLSIHHDFNLSHASERANVTLSKGWINGKLYCMHFICLLHHDHFWKMSTAM